jgi:DNA polymerase-3 subunit gamma/tau
MSYVVLARKYRPRSFQEMVGQDHVVRALTHALENQRLHHAYLFTGTRGIGKTTVSRILAKSLNCTGADGQGGITAQPCGVCTACREIDADRYIDYVEMDAASNRSIDEIRELIERAAYKPSVGRFKVFMIDEAHQLTKDAFNALLKTLEEPPAYLKFVLATTDPERMLPTVLSRCLQFNLRPMAPQTVAEHLSKVLAAESIPAEPAALRLLSRAARGSMRDALSLTDQAIAYGAGRLDEGPVRAMLGTVDRSHAVRLVAALSARDGKAVLGECEGLRAMGLSGTGTLEEIARLLQQMAVEQAVPGALDPNDGDTEGARQMAPTLAPDETQLLYSMAIQGRAELPLAPDEYAGLVMVLLRFLAFPASGGEAPTKSTRPAAALSAAPPIAVAKVAVAPPAIAAAKVSATPPPWMDEAPMEGFSEVPSRVAPEAPAERFEPPPALPRQFAALQASEVLPQAAPLPPASAPTAPAVAPAQGAARAGEHAVVRTALGDVWAEAVAALQTAGLIGGLVRELALQSELVDRLESSPQAAEAEPGGAPAGALWRVRVERDSLRSITQVDKLQAALRAWTGDTALKLEAVLGIAEDSPARREAEWAALRQRKAEEAVHASPLVQGLLRQFSSARILPGSIRPV